MVDLTIARIRKWMALYAVTPRMLADELNYSSAHMRKVLNDKARLMPENTPRILTYFTERRNDAERTAALMSHLDQCA